MKFLEASVIPVTHWLICSALLVFLGCDKPPAAPADMQPSAQMPLPHPEATSEIPPSASEVKTEVQRLLEEGNALCEKLPSLALRREFAEMEAAYESLRLSYPKLVDQIAGLPAADQASTLAALERWEDVITRWRLAKQQLSAPPDTSDVGSGNLKLSDEMRDRLKELFQDSENARKQKEAADAPLEQALDAAIATAQQLRRANP